MDRYFVKYKATYIRHFRGTEPYRVKIEHSTIVSLPVGFSLITVTDTLKQLHPISVLAGYDFLTVFIDDIDKIEKM